MRLRLGFVTNSSSTNHLVWWNGKKSDLKKLLTAHVERLVNSARFDREERKALECRYTGLVKAEDIIDRVIKPLQNRAEKLSKPADYDWHARVDWGYEWGEPKDAVDAFLLWGDFYLDEDDILWRTEQEG